jgi:hypothetical protein
MWSRSPPTIPFAPRMLRQGDVSLWFDQWEGRWCAVVGTVEDVDDLAAFCAGLGIDAPTDEDVAWCREEG